MKNYIILLLISVFISGCTTDFEDINTNPNASENIDPEFLLTNVISVTADKNTYEQGFRLSNFITQFSSDIEFERIDRYEMGSNSGWWNHLYSMISDINSMQTVSTTNEAYIAVGNILKAYIYGNLTDMWGDVPYSEAGMAVDGITSPAYDAQEVIYTGDNGILAKLKESANVLDNTSATISGDVLYNGDLTKWVKLANALRIRYIMRASDKLTDFNELQAIVDSGAIMQGNEDSAILPYLSNAPNQFPLSFAAQGIYNGHRMSSTVQDILLGWNDPRIEVLFKPTAKSVQEGTPEYVGLQNGQTRETISAKGIDLNNVSLFGVIFRDVPDGIDAQIMQYAEQQFALAEAVERGLITGNAEGYYHDGIQAQFNYYDIVMPSDYLDRDGVSYTDDKLEKIATQKWMSLINNGHEAWFEVRRTGYPNLTPGPDNLNDDRYPSRYLYPEGEQATNAENYNEAINRQGPDDINTKVWWEK